MKATKLLLFMAVFGTLALSSCATDTITEDEINANDVLVAPRIKQIEVEIMELINAHRINEGLNPLNQHQR